MDTSNIIQNILIYALPVLLAITVHEAAHGYAARHFGDNTAYALGRITLNPLKHIDPIGTVLMPLLLIFAGSPFLFGYAKPVPVQFGRLRNPKRDMVWVALAGPMSNLVMALIWGVLLYLMKGLDVDETFFIKMAQGGVRVNAVMFAFNLFPLPPLDGGRILVGLLPHHYAAMVARIEPWGFFIVMGLVVTGVISTIWMQPMMNVTYSILELFLAPLAYLVN
ncbi:MAG TPA: site-2 protease family protein [Burkholderiaceae bacterium]|nr:site-2 protease family protein [Burkholderiaceae bacterium]